MKCRLPAREDAAILERPDEMTSVIFDSASDDAERRRRLHDGDIFVFGPRPEALRLRDRVLALVDEEAPGLRRGPVPSPLELQSALGRLRKRVARDVSGSVMLKELLAAYGCEPRRTYRHRLFFRAVPPVMGPGPDLPAFHAAPHRDVWLSAPRSQVNWWMPLTELCEESCLLLYPRFWLRPVANDSAGFDYAAYKARFASAFEAAGSTLSAPQVGHPRALDQVDPEEAVRLICPPGGLILFSAGHLHASAVNRSGALRLSADFRTCHADDLEQGNGPADVDSHCTGSSLVDFRGLDGSMLAG